MQREVYLSSRSGSFYRTARKITGVLAAWIAVASMPAGAAPFAYVADQSHGSLLVFDTANNQLATQIPIRAVDQVTVTADGRRVYAVTTESSVAVVDSSGNTVIATISLPAAASTRMTISADGTRAYLGMDGARVAVIDTTTNTLVNSIATPNAGAIDAVAVTPDGTRVYVTDYAGHRVYVIDTATNGVSAAPIDFGPDHAPRRIAITPDGTRAYVACLEPNGGATIDVIDLNSNTLVGSPIPTVDGADVMVMAPDGSRLYMGIFGQGVQAIDTATNTLLGDHISVSIMSHGIDISPDGARLYVTGNSRLWVVNASPYRIIDDIRWTEQSINVAGVAVTPFGAPNWQFATRGQLMFDAIQGGREADGTPLYMCRGNYAAGLHPGKTRPGLGGCNIGWGGAEITLANYQALVPSWQFARNGDVPPRAVSMGAQEAPAPGDFTGAPLYHCRANYNGGLHPGKIRPGFPGCFIAWGGSEVTVPSYEVLVDLSPPVPLTTVFASNGGVPPGALVGGQEQDRERLYLCQGSFNGGVHPGKLRPGLGGCNISWGGREVTLTDYAVLVPGWVSQPNVATYPAGVEADRTPLDVCRGYYQGGIHPGKYRPEFATCHISFGGLEVPASHYELLGATVIH